MINIILVRRAAHRGKKKGGNNDDYNISFVHIDIGEIVMNPFLLH